MEQEFESILEAYPVRLDNFEGPLDLLLHLIKKHEVNIYDIPIKLITQQYIDFLGRLPDSTGFNNWVATLNGCPNGGFGEFDNPTCDRVHVSAGFFLSAEFQGRGYFAYRFYEVALDRRPTYSEFVPDMAVVGGPQSPESEALSKATYTDAWMLWYGLMFMLIVLFKPEGIAGLWQDWRSRGVRR